MEWIKNGGITSPRNFLANGINIGIKDGVKKDLALVTTSRPAVAVGMITKNKVKAIPCLITAKHLETKQAQAIFVNSGNANCGTGEIGLIRTKELLRKLHDLLAFPLDDILVASTGVIGQQLPTEKIAASLDKLVGGLSVDGGYAAAEAIMTTDTKIKEAAVSFKLRNKEARLGGMAKGAGMVHPDMATMLVFLTCDVAISHAMLKKALTVAVDQSFHRLTIDCDTSTNDMVLCLANAAAQNEEITTAESREYTCFFEALVAVCQKLAKDLVKDAEGATKFITITVNEAKDEETASKVAHAVAGSSLVKTAMFGEEANWGRVLMAIGNAGVEIDLNQLSISFGPHVVFSEGCTCASVSDEMLKEVLAAPEITIAISLGMGESTSWIWTSDLSYDYVKINASYKR